MQAFAVGEALEGGEGGAIRLHGEEQAAPHRLALEEHGAGATHAVLASHVGAGEVEVIAQEISEALAHLDTPFVLGAVDVQADGPDGFVNHERWLSVLPRWRARGRRRGPGPSASAPRSGGRRRARAGRSWARVARRRGGPPPR